MLATLEISVPDLGLVGQKEGELFTYVSVEKLHLICQP